MVKMSRRECLWSAVGSILAISAGADTTPAPLDKPGPNRKPLAGNHKGIMDALHIPCA